MRRAGRAQRQASRTGVQEREVGSRVQGPPVWPQSKHSGPTAPPEGRLLGGGTVPSTPDPVSEPGRPAVTQRCVPRELARGPLSPGPPPRRRTRVLPGTGLRGRQGGLTASAPGARVSGLPWARRGCEKRRPPSAVGQKHGSTWTRSTSCYSSRGGARRRTGTATRPEWAGPERDGQHRATEEGPQRPRPAPRIPDVARLHTSFLKSVASNMPPLSGQRKVTLQRESSFQRGSACGRRQPPGRALQASPGGPAAGSKPARLRGDASFPRNSREGLK